MSIFFVSQERMSYSASRQEDSLQKAEIIVRACREPGGPWYVANVLPWLDRSSFFCSTSGQLVSECAALPAEGLFGGLTKDTFYIWKGLAGDSSGATRDPSRTVEVRLERPAIDSMATRAGPHTKVTEEFGYEKGRQNTQYDREGVRTQTEDMTTQETDRHSFYDEDTPAGRLVWALSTVASFPQTDFLSDSGNRRSNQSGRTVP